MIGCRRGWGRFIGMVVIGAMVATAGTEAAAAATVTKADQTIDLGQLPASPPVGTQAVLPTTSSAGLGVSYSAAGSCVANGNRIRFIAAGSLCTVTATQGGSAAYNPAAPQVRTATPSRGSQTIALASLPSGLDIGSTVAIAATASSGLLPTLLAAGPCALAGSTLTMTGTGTCTLTATQAGDANWLPATTVVRSTIVKASQSITFAPLPASPPVGTSILLAATSSAGVGVSYVATGACTAAGPRIRFISAGVICSVTARQDGNSFVRPATPVTRTTTPVPGTQTISLASLPTGRSAGESFPLVAATNSGLPVTLSVSGSCTLAGTTVTVTGPGTCTATASQPGNADWAPAPSVSRSTATSGSPLWNACPPDAKVLQTAMVAWNTQWLTGSPAFVSPWPASEADLVTAGLLQAELTSYDLVGDGASAPTLVRTAGPCDGLIDDSDPALLACKADTRTLKTAMVAWNAEWLAGDDPAFTTPWPTSEADLVAPPTRLLESESALHDLVGDSAGATAPTITASPGQCADEVIIQLS